MLKLKFYLVATYHCQAMCIEETIPQRPSFLLPSDSVYDETYGLKIQQHCIIYIPPIVHFVKCQRE